MRRFSSCAEFEAHSVIKILKKNENSVQKPKLSKVAFEEKTKCNQNEMGIQMISKKLYEQIFKNVEPNQMLKTQTER